MAQTGSDTMGSGTVQMGKAASLDTVTLSSGVQIVAHPSNAGIVYVGYANTVTANSKNTTDGVPLAAGAGYFVPKINAPTIGSVFLVGSASTQTITFDPQ